MSKGPGKSFSNKIIILRLAGGGPGQEKYEGCLSKGQAGIQFFFVPW